MSWDGFGFAIGAVAMLLVFYALSLGGLSQAPNFISRDVARAGWGQSDGRVYRVTPAEVVPSQEHRP